MAHRTGARTPRGGVTDSFAVDAGLHRGRDAGQVSEPYDLGRPEARTTRAPDQDRDAPANRPAPRPVPSPGCASAPEPTPRSMASRRALCSGSHGAGTDPSGAAGERCTGPRTLSEPCSSTIAHPARKTSGAYCVSSANAPLGDAAIASTSSRSRWMSRAAWYGRSDSTTTPATWCAAVSSASAIAGGANSTTRSSTAPSGPRSTTSSAVMSAPDLAERRRERAK